MEPGEPGNRVFGANITYLILILAAKIYDFLTPIPYAMHFFSRQILYPINFLHKYPVFRNPLTGPWWHILLVLHTVGCWGQIESRYLL